MAGTENYGGPCSPMQKVYKPPLKLPKLTLAFTLCDVKEKEKNKGHDKLFSVCVCVYNMTLSVVRGM